jgi:hypothetical protein
MRLIFRFGGLWCFFRQRMKRLAAWLKSGAVRLMVGQPLSLAAAHRFDHALFVANGPMVVAEVELREVAVKCFS